MEKAFELYDGHTFERDDVGVETMVKSVITSLDALSVVATEFHEEFACNIDSVCFVLTAENVETRTLPPRLRKYIIQRESASRYYLATLEAFDENIKNVFPTAFAVANSDAVNILTVYTRAVEARSALATVCAAVGGASTAEVRNGANALVISKLNRDCARFDNELHQTSTAALRVFAYAIAWLEFTEIQARYLKFTSQRCRVESGSTPKFLQGFVKTEFDKNQNKMYDVYARAGRCESACSYVTKREDCGIIGKYDPLGSCQWSARLSLCMSSRESLQEYPLEASFANFLRAGFGLLPIMGINTFGEASIFATVALNETIGGMYDLFDIFSNVFSGGSTEVRPTLNEAQLMGDTVNRAKHIGNAAYQKYTNAYFEAQMSRGKDVIKRMADDAADSFEERIKNTPDLKTASADAAREVDAVQRRELDREIRRTEYAEKENLINKDLRRVNTEDVRDVEMKSIQRSETVKKMAKSEIPEVSAKSGRALEVLTQASERMFSRFGRVLMFFLKFSKPFVLSVRDFIFGLLEFFRALDVILSGPGGSREFHALFEIFVATAETMQYMTTVIRDSVGELISDAANLVIVFFAEFGGALGGGNPGGMGEAITRIATSLPPLIIKYISIFVEIPVNIFLTSPFGKMFAVIFEMICEVLMKMVSFVKPVQKIACSVLKLKLPVVGYAIVDLLKPELAFGTDVTLDTLCNAEVPADLKCKFGGFSEQVRCYHAGFAHLFD